jgi:hypothetical protein
MDELQRYLVRHRRRLKFALAVRDPSEPARWARLTFEVVLPIHAVVAVDGRTYESGLTDLWETHFGLAVDGRGLVDVEDRMAAAGWTNPRGHSDESDQHYLFDRPRPPDTAATLAAIARETAEAVLGTDRYRLTIEPYQGDANYIGEYAGYRSLMTVAGFVVTAPIVATLAALATGSPSRAALIWGALLAIAALYLLQPRREPARLRPTLDLQVALMKLEMALHESAIVEPPVVGPPVELVLSLAVILVGAWVPIVVAIVITSAV